MKYLIFSDLHGSIDSLNIILDIFKKDGYDKLIFLGDLLYHGPRNGIPLGYNPKEVAKVVSEIKDKMIFIKGNCDAEVDEMVTGVKEGFEKIHDMAVSDINLHFTHGHQLSRFEPSSHYSSNDYVFYGHYHVFDISKINNTTYINIGSVTIPKDGIRGYASLEDKHLKFIDFNGNTFKEMYL